MAQHVRAAAIIAVAACLLAFQGVLLFWQQPRDLLWYTKLAIVVYGEWVSVNLARAASSARGAIETLVALHSW